MLCVQPTLASSKLLTVPGNVIKHVSICAEISVDHAFFPPHLEHPFIDVSSSMDVMHFYPMHIKVVITQKHRDCCTKDWRTNLAREALISVCC